MTVNQTELASILGVSTRQIRNLERAGLPCSIAGKRKAYPIPAAVQWWRDREVARALEPYSTTDLEKERARWLAARTGKAELELANLRGELVPMDEVAGMLREAMETLDSVLRGSPSRFAPALALAAGLSTKRARLVLDDLIELVRAALRNGGL